MKRIACKVSYDGTNYSGYQVQPEKRTVQYELEKALHVLHKGAQIKVVASGRTDATVHARGQVIHFDSPLNIGEHQWPKALNACLPNDIRILEAAIVENEFHARYSVREKEYRYKVQYKETNVFTRNFQYFVPYFLDISAMREAASYLVGTFDFSSFCAANTDVKDKIRTVKKIDVMHDGNELTFVLVGNGFLYNMVRIIVGTLLEIGAGKRPPSEMKKIRNGMKRELAGKTAPGHGLYLWDVTYDTPIFKG
ncbi:tRNA pseudouridine(38-40) synthase TruA [Bacillus solitudinis]|uniref:tRNA pseudouridine(38-40) synthase TruA n=1 Tax=Bacillus solitudinis TaxID=2014074 RepID=UPI000C23A8DD|nr:tRNA pseudouridine(38-40) synthase TruA [Bacillus solitudinis]